MAIDLDAAYTEFSHLKTQEIQRNQEYYLLRQAVKGNFRWPRDWPNHIPKLKRNVLKPIVRRLVAYQMGKGFTFNVDRPNNLEYREAAERTEKILSKLFALSKADIQFIVGAYMGSTLGRTIFKVYKSGQKGSQHACFSICQPDYFYGIPAADNALGDFSTVYYSYPIDILEARRRYGNLDFKSELWGGKNVHYDPIPETWDKNDLNRKRRIPVLEVWTRDEYALVVGGVTVYNGPTPPEYKWKATGEGFIPFTVIENIRNGDDLNRGEADIAQARELNELLNQLISRKYHIVNRWLVPTVVWEGAPQNYAEIMAQTVAGGGAIPARLGAKLYFLAYDRPNPAVLEMEQELRQAILESCGMSEIALQGTVQGSINTGPALAAQFQPVLSTVEEKRKEWTYGIKDLSAKLLNVQEHIGDSKALGQAVINQTEKSKDYSDGELVDLSGKDIQGLRDVVVNWPGVLPKDDIESARLEMEKAAQGFQSIYTTLEKLGEEYPDDEIARIRMENNDPSLRGEKVAEQMRAQTPLIKAQMDQEQKMAEMMMQGGGGEVPEDFSAAPSEEELLAQGDIGARLRELQRRKPSLNLDEDEPVIEAGAEAVY